MSLTAAPLPPDHRYVHVLRRAAKSGKLDFSGEKLSEIPREVNQLLTTLLSFSLKSNQLKRLDRLRFLNLETLDLGDNRLKSLPEDIYMPCLKVLKINRNELKVLPETMALLPSLEVLDISNNNFRELPSCVCLNTTLQELSATNNFITALPAELANLSTLKILRLSSNYLKELRAEICLLGCLEVLELNSNDLVEFPDDFHKLSQLQTLNVSENKLVTLPKLIYRLSKLQFLSFNNNKVGRLEDFFGYVLDLKEVQGMNNQLTELPETIGGLKKLTFLDLSGNAIAALPSSIGKLVSLDKFDLSRNKLTTVPREFGFLENLTMARLDQNEITYLPPEIGRLRNVFQLFLHKNKLVYLPPEFGNLHRLGQLTLKGNPIVIPPKSITSEKECSSAVKKYFEALNKQNSHLLARAKVMVLGESMAGKTSLVRTLIRGKSTLTETADRTIALDIQSMVLDRKPGSSKAAELPDLSSMPENVAHAYSSALNSAEFTNFRWDFFDFGGHEEYQPFLYLFYSTERTVYFVLCDFSRPVAESHISFWIKSVCASAPGAVVVLIGTKCDCISSSQASSQASLFFEVATEALKDFNESLSRSLKATQYEGTRNNEKRRKLQQISSNALILPGSPDEILLTSSARPEELRVLVEKKLWSLVTNPEYQNLIPYVLPRSWVVLADYFEHEASKTMREMRYEDLKMVQRELCRFEGDDSDLDSAIDFFHTLGVILHFKTDALRETVFLQPQWMVNLLKVILRHDFAEKISQYSMLCNPEWIRSLKNGELVLDMIPVLIEIFIRETQESAWIERSSKEQFISLIGELESFKKNPSYLLLLMHEFQLAFPIQPAEDQAHAFDGGNKNTGPICSFVPMLLPEARPDFKWVIPVDAIGMARVFKVGFVPASLTPHLLAKFNAVFPHFVAWKYGGMFVKKHQGTEVTVFFKVVRNDDDPYIVVVGAVSKPSSNPHHLSENSLRQVLRMCGQIIEDEIENSFPGLFIEQFVPCMRCLLKQKISSVGPLILRTSTLVEVAKLQDAFQHNRKVNCSSCAIHFDLPSSLLLSTFNCENYAKCRVILDSLGLPDELLDRAFDACFCRSCMQSKEGFYYGTRGNPPRVYAFPIGWCRFGLHVDPIKAKLHRIFEDWHVAFHGTTLEGAKAILESPNMELLRAGDVTFDGVKLSVALGHIEEPHTRFNPHIGTNEKFNPHQVFTSPSPRYIESPCYCRTASYKGMDFIIGFQVRQKPGSYEVGPSTVVNPTHEQIDPLGMSVPELSNECLEYYTDRRGTTVLQSLLIRLKSESEPNILASPSAFHGSVLHMSKTPSKNYFEQREVP